MTRSFHLLPWLLLLLLLPGSCRPGTKGVDPEDVYTNPVSRSVNNTGYYYEEGYYYFVQNHTGRVLIQKMKDPTDADLEKMSVAAEMKADYGLEHLWRPQITRIDGVWYIYVTADDGNTDNHKMYVLENRNADPTEGRFTMAGRLVTDPGDNWAMHGYVFHYGDGLYMVWSGWESRRAYVETQCLYISRMKDPLTMSGERVLISRPEYEWERQCVQRDGSSLRYPVYVNEHPFFFDCAGSDKLYIFYSASAGWTDFSCIGELSAPKDADILDPASWSKAPVPAFSEDREREVFGPSVPCLIPSPDGKAWFLVYSASGGGNILTERSTCIQPVTFSATGHPELGRPAGWDERLTKPTRVSAKYLPSPTV